MTTEGIADTATTAEDERQFCYRHPQRETYVRCGRCDRPICTACAMLGPVGLRCRQCGRPALDPLTSFTLQQVLVSLVVAVAGGTVIGLISSQLGWIGLIVSFLGGSFVAEGARRSTGYKQGRVMLAIAAGGLLGGALLGHGIAEVVLLLTLDVDPQLAGLLLPSLVAQTLVGGLISGAIAAVGAYTRLR